MARSKMIMVRVDEAEHALFKEAARRVSISMSEYARDAMLARMALEEITEPVTELPDPVLEERVRVVDETPWLVEEPGDVPAAVERAAPDRSFTPFSKEQQTGRAAKKRVKAEPAFDVCRHGLLRCKVCGTHP